MIRPAIRIGALCALLAAAAPSVAVETTLVAAGADWRYLADGSDQGSAWRGPAFNDSSWPQGPAQLGFGDGDEATAVPFGADPAGKPITTYFRRTFSIADPSPYRSLELRVLYDDATIAYLNGTEVYRGNLPNGSIAFNRLAQFNRVAPDESTFVAVTISPALLAAGTNTLAVEVHQASKASPDLSFDLALAASDLPRVVRGPYLQMATPTGMVVRWRTDAASSSRVRYGPDPDHLDQSADDPTLTTEHEVTLGGLAPDTAYAYSVGEIATPLAGGPDFRFRTSLSTPDPARRRIWVLGDSGSRTREQWQVRDAYERDSGAAATDLWLMLGDNAYNDGTDAEYQAAVFAAYPQWLRRSPLWPTIGNHDTGESPSPPPSLPYYQIFSLPTAAEAGGVASGTEDYYSFDFGDIHFICLDSMTSDRSPQGAMLTWLDADLAATSAGWIIAFWHHPPYSHGGHNSDIDIELTEMRANALPKLEDAGVDLVLSGHSHSYERSFLLDHHYGISTTLTSDMILDSGSGRIDQGGAYHKATDGKAAHEGAVYTVAGSSGQVTPVLPHPAMYLSLSRLGSLVLEIESNRLEVRFLREDGRTDDYFTIEKGSPPAGNVRPTVTLTSPAGGSVLTAPAAVPLAADAFDPDGTVTRVDFYRGETLIGSALSSPWTLDWNGVGASGYTLTARAADDGGASASSAPVSILVTPPAPPPAPAGLQAVAICSTRIELSFGESASDEDGFRVERSTDGVNFLYRGDVGPDVTEFWDTLVSAGTTYHYRVIAYNTAGDSSASALASAATEGAVPAAPTSLVATPACATRIDLAWTDNSCNETGFKIERSTDGLSFTQIATVGANVTVYASKSLVPGTTYWYRVRAYSGTLYNSPYSNLASATTAPALPAAPSGLTATPLSGSQIRLDWTDNACNESGFRIERATGAGPFSQVAQVGANIKTWTNSGLAPSTGYSYRVRAYNGTGNSPYSNLATATTLASIPAAPSALGAVPFCQNRIDLAWTDNASDEVGFKIERSTNGVDFTQIATVSANVKIYKNTGLIPNTTYWYRVRAYNASGDSGYSNVASATTLSAVPSAPTSLVATTVSSMQIRLNWVDTSCNETGFKVERATGGGAFVQVATVAKNLQTWIDSGLAPNTTYSYRIRAYAGSGNSDYSNVATATTNP